mmetsp:Transcript_37883/g.75159  ORF Transcript_37883/g.75159 Transcript_37883/m.75159 type:complete len:273 (-) Transcript_37883:303-1121(-)
MQQLACESRKLDRFTMPRTRRFRECACVSARFAYLSCKAPLVAARCCAQAAGAASGRTNKVCSFVARRVLGWLAAMGSCRKIADRKRRIFCQKIADSLPSIPAIAPQLWASAWRISGHRTSSSCMCRIEGRAFGSTIVVRSTITRQLPSDGASEGHCNEGLDLRRCKALISSASSSCMGCLPETIQNSKQPKEYTSAALEGFVEGMEINSGAFHLAVPPSGFACRVSTRARPKSRSLAWTTSFSSGEPIKRWIITLEGLRSPCTTHGVHEWR